MFWSFWGRFGGRGGVSRPGRVWDCFGIVSGSFWGRLGVRRGRAWTTILSHVGIILGSSAVGPCTARHYGCPAFSILCLFVFDFSVCVHQSVRPSVSLPLCLSVSLIQRCLELPFKEKTLPLPQAPLKCSTLLAAYRAPTLLAACRLACRLPHAVVSLKAKPWSLSFACR